MIHTNELMLGNWVEYATGLNKDKRSISMYVQSIHKDTVLLNFEGNEADPFEVDDKDLLGIPITEELLEKCGIYPWFEFYTNKEGFKVYHSSSKWYIRACATIVYVDFLHELQNAYFMLTKKHLEVKL